jgi:hypothetical protein
MPPRFIRTARFVYTSGSLERLYTTTRHRQSVRVAKGGGNAPGLFGSIVSFKMLYKVKMH